jgi:hypothetical protein
MHDVSMHRFALVAILVTTAHAETLDARFVPAIRAAAQGYAKWGRVDERPNIAPGLCRAPMPGDYGSTGDVRLTRADDDSPHGKKLYYLYASARTAYLGLVAKDAPLPVGFAIVKQSWTPRSASKAEIDERERVAREHERTLQMSERYVQSGRSWVVADGHYLVADKQRDLFVMTKVGAGNGTDAGWVYGTVAPDGSVTSAGRVTRCMGCHEAASHERLFGLAKEPAPSAGY